MTKEEQTNSCFLSLKKAANTPLWIDKIMGFLCIMMKGWDRECGDNEISVLGGKGWDGEHDDGENVTVMGWDVRIKKKPKR